MKIANRKFLFRLSLSPRLLNRFIFVYVLLVTDLIMSQM